MIYKITFSRISKSLRFIGFIFLFIVVFTIHQKFHPAIVTSGGVLFLIQFIPVIYLLIEYSVFNRGLNFEIDYKSQKLVFFSRKGSRELSFNNIAKIEMFMAPSYFRESKIQFLPFEPFHFAKIISKNGDKIILTSLVIENLFEELRKINGVEIIRKKRLIASILLEG